MPRQSILVSCPAFEARAVCYAGGRGMDAFERHPAHELFYQTAGISRCQAGDKAYKLCAGAMLLLPAGTAHRITVPRQAPVRGIEIHFAPDFLRPLQPACPREMPDTALQSGEAVLLTAPANGEPLIAAIPQRLARLSAEPEAAAMPECRLLLAALLLALRPQLEAAMQPGGPAAQRLAEAVQIFLAEHYAEPCGLPALAARMGVSPAHLSRSFKRATGVGVNACLAAMRVRAAQACLRAGEQDLAAVARRCGFGTDAQFRRVFKAACGVTPSRYRRSCRQQKAPAAAGE